MLSRQRHEPSLWRKRYSALFVATPPSERAFLGLLQHVWQVFGVDVVEHVHLANDLLWVVAEHLPEGGACVPQSAVGIDYRDVFRGILHDRAQPAVVFSGHPAVMPGLIGTT